MFASGVITPRKPSWTLNMGVPGGCVVWKSDLDLGWMRSPPEETRATVTA